MKKRTIAMITMRAVLTYKTGLNDGMRFILAVRFRYRDSSESIPHIRFEAYHNLCRSDVRGRTNIIIRTVASSPRAQGTLLYPKDWHSYSRIENRPGRRNHSSHPHLCGGHRILRCDERQQC